MVGTGVDVRAATRATYLAFIGSGFAFASWASRIPQVRDRLHLSPAELGLVLLAIAAGSLIALPLSGPLVARFGSRRTVAVMALLLASGWPSWPSATWSASRPWSSGCSCSASPTAPGTSR